MARLVQHQGIRHRHAAATQDGLDACHQLAGAEGLAHIVVRAQIEADQAVDLLDARRHHDDRHIGERAQLAADVEAVAPGQHQIQQDQVGCIRAHPGHHLQAIGDAMRLEALGLEVIGLERGELGLVLDDEDAVHWATGSESETRSPPSGEGTALISPSCACAMLRQIARPRPVPPFARLREASTR